MHIHVRIVDRIGIVLDILKLLREFDIAVSAIEMILPDLYISMPEAVHTEDVRAAIVAIAGVRDVTIVSALPSELSKRHLKALLEATVDPVLALDPSGKLLFANQAASSITGVDFTHPRSLKELPGGDHFIQNLVENDFELGLQKVALGRTSFLVEARPMFAVSREIGTLLGGVVTLHVLSKGAVASHTALATPFDALLGESGPMLALKARASRWSVLEAPLMILGETGTGKEVVAHACHLASVRKSAPFLALNCAALPDSLAESELFGYATGAFSGANRGGKAGLLEQANHGTIFLDEVGEMSLPMQAKLLRVLNDGRFRRIGADRETSVDVRVMSATHRNLEEMVAQGLFREDLFYRLSVLDLRIAPLRERGDDIMLLAQHFLESACEQVRRPLCRLSTGAQAILRSHAWPGNVRQLRNVIFRSVAVADSTIVGLEGLEVAKVASSTPTVRFFDEWESLDQAVALFEKELLEALYPHHPSCRLLASRLKTSHTTVANKLRKHGIVCARP